MDSSGLIIRITGSLSHWLLGLCIVFFCCLSHAESSRIAVLLSGNSPFYKQTADQLRATLHQQMRRAPDIDIFQATSDETTSLEEQHYRLIISVGTKATQIAAEQFVSTPVLATFIPKSGFEQISANLPQTSLAKKEQRQFSAIFLDQPLLRFVNLGRLLQPKATQFGTVLGPVSQQYLGELQNISAQMAFTLHQITLDNQDNPLGKLGPIVEKSDIFIAIPDQAILNRAAAKWILYLSFRQKIPVIGFSKAYTDAGALASVYTSPENVGTQAGELISRWLGSSDDAIWQPQYPAYCTISTNPAVARALSINLSSPAELNEALSNMENKAP